MPCGACAMDACVLPAQMMDARSAGRFLGTEPEPRAGLRGGHIPGSRSLPFMGLLEPGNSR